MYDILGIMPGGCVIRFTIGDRIVDEQLDIPAPDTLDELVRAAAEARETQLAQEDVSKIGVVVAAPITLDDLESRIAALEAKGG